MEFSEGLTSIKAPHFVLYVKEQLEEMYGETLVEQGGLRVTTTLDYELHQEAQAIVTEEIDKVSESAGMPSQYSHSDSSIWLCTSDIARTRKNRTTATAEAHPMRW